MPIAHFLRQILSLLKRSYLGALSSSKERVVILQVYLLLRLHLLPIPIQGAGASVAKSDMLGLCPLSEVFVLTTIFHLPSIQLRSLSSLVVQVLGYLYLYSTTQGLWSSGVVN